MHMLSWQHGAKGDSTVACFRLESDIGSSVDRKYYQDEEDDDADYENMTQEERGMFLHAYQSFGLKHTYLC